jgi:hypothetical protein
MLWLKRIYSKWSFLLQPHLNRVGQSVSLHIFDVNIAIVGKFVVLSEPTIVHWILIFVMLIVHEFGEVDAVISYIF